MLVKHTEKTDNTENTENLKLHNAAQMQTGQNIQTIRKIQKIWKIPYVLPEGRKFESYPRNQKNMKPYSHKSCRASKLSKIVLQRVE